MGNSKSTSSTREDENDNEDTENHDEAKYGKPHKYDPNFKGPIPKRSCTDVCCFLIFLLFFLAFIAVGAWAFVMGDPRLLLYPTDTQGNICGEGEYHNRSYLFFFDLVDCFTAGPGAIFALGCPTTQVCIKNCPTSYWTWVESKLPLVPEEIVRGKMICQYGVNPVTSSKTIEQLVDDDDCAAYYLNTESLLGRCVPAVIAKAANSAGNVVSTAHNITVMDKSGNPVNGSAIGENLDQAEGLLSLLLKAHEYGMLVLQDIKATWWLILVGLALAMLLSLLWILLMRWIAAPMVWLSLLAFVGLFGFATWYCFASYIELKHHPDADKQEFILTTDFSYYLHLKDTWLAFGIIAVCFLVIILIIMLVLRKRILISIELVSEASKAVGTMPSTLIWPIVPFILHVLVLAYWLASALYLTATARSFVGVTNTSMLTGDPSKDAIKDLLLQLPCPEDESTTEGRLCRYIKYGGDEYVVVLQIFQLFMWFWLMFFVTALGEMTLAGAFSTYYWSMNKKKDIPCCPTWSSFGRALRYHLGSVAFGSLIVAILRLIRAILSYMEKKMKGAENACAKFCLKCCVCCFWCLEKIFKYINKNAYIMIAIYGNNFCTSSKNGLKLIMRNIIRVAVVDKVTDFLIFIGKLMVVGGIGVLSFYFFRGDIPFVNKIIVQPKLNYYLIPVLVVSIGTYVIASVFFSVYSMGVDTLFLCFLDDLERNDGSTEKQYYMSKGLQKILDKRNLKDPANRETTRV